MNYTFSDYYNDIKNDENNFSNWFPKVENCGIKVPKSIIIPVPEEIMRCFYMEKETDREKIEEFVKTEVFPKLHDFPYFLFLKNGTFSDKFHFNECAIWKNFHELVVSVININYDALVLGAGGTAELIIREYLGATDVQNHYRIYNGMPLRPEFRVFYDFDRKKSLYSVNYWDWDYCHRAIGRDKTDKVVYEAAYPDIQAFYEQHEKEVREMVERHMAGIEGLSGVWSVDIMHYEEEDEYYLIDMAIGKDSAYYDPEKIKKE